MIYGFKDDKEKVALLDLFYPVGTVYKTRNSSFNPNTAWGGTWTKIEGRFLLASSGSYPIGSTGGNANAIVPAHTHGASTGSAGTHDHEIKTIKNNVGLRSGSTGTIVTVYTYDNGSKRTESAGAHSHTVTINSTGESVAGKNMPPYLVVNVWTRTA